MTTAAPGQDSARKNLPRWLVPLVVLVVLAVGAAITAAVVNRGDTSTGARSAAQLSQVQASCGSWMTSSQSDDQSDTEWCTKMFAWMSDQSGGSMMSSMMWQGPEQLGNACRAWVDQDRAETRASDQQRCTDMVEWMDGHMSGRDGSWMRQGR